MTEREVIQAIRAALRLEYRRQDAEREKLNEEIIARRHDIDKFVDECWKATREGFES